MSHRRPLGRCTASPLCPNRATVGGRCESHARRAEQLRGSASSRGYDAVWRERRAAFLARHPNCEVCGAPATEADHEPTRRELVAAGIADPDDERYLHALCHPHHSEKTAAQSPGGWNAR